MGKVTDADGNEIPWSDVFATLGMHDAAAEAFLDENEVHDPTCLSLPYAVPADVAPGVAGSLVADREVFDCLLCRFSFYAEATRVHAHLSQQTADYDGRPAARKIGTHPDLGLYAMCDCCWRKMLADPELLAQAREAWAAENVTLTAAVADAITARP